MKQSDATMYLGDLITNDGKNLINLKNIESKRANRAKGTDIIYSGEYYVSSIPI